jgi:hypothetical protein
MAKTLTKVWLVALMTIQIFVSAAGHSETLVGSKTIQMTKSAAVRISGLVDIIFPPGQTPPASQKIGVCVYSNNGGVYSVSASSANANGAEMRLRSGDQFIRYGAQWMVSNGGTINLESGLATGEIDGADITSPTCNAGANAWLSVTLASDSYLAAPSGIYADVLSISISSF